MQLKKKDINYLFTETLYFLGKYSAHLVNPECANSREPEAYYHQKKASSYLCKKAGYYSNNFRVKGSTAKREY